MSRAKRITATAAALGIAAGGLAAAVVPRTTQGEPKGPTPFLAPPGALREAPARPTDSTPFGRMSPTVTLRPGSARTELRRRDPAGGPDWVIRSFTITERFPPMPGRSGGSRTATSSCVQLGREHRGRFGWVDGDHVFRPVDRARYGNQIRCGNRSLTRKKEIQLQLTTLIGHPTRPDRAVLGSVLWGTTGNPVEQLTFAAAGRRDTVDQTRSGAFIAFYGPDRSPSDVLATSRYAGGAEKTESLMPRDWGSAAARIRQQLPTLRPETRRIVARAPDPGGGPSWGVVAARSESGQWCVAEQGTIVGDRIGQIDPVAGTLFEQDPRATPGSCPEGKFPPGQAISMTSSYGNPEGQELLAPDGERTLRLQRGRSSMYGIAREDVERITFASPRDVRSIVPSGPARAFIVVWDGDFAASGSVRITQHLRDGSTRVYVENLTW